MTDNWGTPQGKATARMYGSKWGLSSDEYIDRRRQGLKGCNVCRVWLPISLFALNATNGTLRPVCKDCRPGALAKLQKERLDTKVKARNRSSIPAWKRRRKPITLRISRLKQTRPRVWSYLNRLTAIYDVADPPAKRGDCPPPTDPCPWVWCRYH